jgi:transposase
MGRQLPKKRACLRGRGKVYFVDGAHLLHNAVPSQGWIKRGHTVELRTNSGRNRLNVLGAFSPDDYSLVSIAETASCDIGLVSRLLYKLRAANPGRQLLVVLDNASYQRAKAVCALAKQLDIQLLFLPPYSPNLNLIERFWKFLRKKVTRNLFHPTFADFRSAVQRVLDNVAAFADELSTLMTENFHLFGAKS